MHWTRLNIRSFATIAPPVDATIGLLAVKGEKIPTDILLIYVTGKTNADN